MKGSIRVDQYTVDCFFLVFPYQTAWQYSDGDPLTRASNTGAIALFDHCSRLCRFISRMIQATYSGGNRKSCVRTAPFSMTLNHL